MAAGATPQYASLYVGDLHPDVTEAMLYEVFNAVGPVGTIRVCRDSVSRRSLGYAYVNYHSVSDAERAIDTLNYNSIKGRSCRVLWSQRDPSARKNAVGNIFVKNLDKNIDNKALYDTFSLFGNILSCKVSMDEKGGSRGYGFVHFETEEAANTAIQRVNGMMIGDKTVEVAMFVKARTDNPKENYTNLYIKNLPSDFTEEQLKDLFSQHGTITSTCLQEDKQGRSFAFVNFEITEMAKKAVEELHGRDMRTPEQKANSGADDETDFLYVGRAQTKAERARDFGKGQGKGQETRGSSGTPSGVTNLYIKNVDDDTTDAQLRALFEPFGTISSAATAKDGSGRCRGFGFVSFETPDEATKAVTEMHLKVVAGKPLYVGLAEKREDRAERLKQRYQPGKGKDGGKGMPGMGGFKGGFGKGGMGGMGGMDGPCGKGGKGPMGGGMGGPMMGGMGGMGNPMMGGCMGGKPGMMGGPMGGMMPSMPMMGMMPGKGGPGMMPMGMPGKGGPMMCNPQMMAMMGGKPGGMPPQMMAMMGKGGHMPQMMPQQQPQQGQPPMPHQGQPPAQQQPAQAPPQQLTAAALAAAPAGVQKQMLGEKLFPAISRHQPEAAGKITGMMLEMDNSELLMLLESDDQLKGKITEAMRVLEGRGA